MAAGEPQKPLRVLIIDGRFPADLTQRLEQSLPHVRRAQVAGREVLATDTSWLSLSETRLLWASDERALEGALANRLTLPPLPHDLAMLTSVTPRAKFPGISELAGTLGLGSKDWERLTLSMPRDANTSELRIYAETDRAAKALLQAAQNQLNEVRASPVPIHQQTAAKFSVEAEDNSVAFRFAGPIDELTRALGALKPQAAHAHAHP